jgi:hypothetical protein
MHGNEGISIWFFIGISLLVNGLLIFATGLYELWYPLEREVVLFHLHASVWWGALLTLAGALYCYGYAPSRRRT